MAISSFFIELSEAVLAFHALYLLRSFIYTQTSVILFFVVLWTENAELVEILRGLCQSIGNMYVWARVSTFDFLLNRWQISVDAIELLSAQRWSRHSRPSIKPLSMITRLSCSFWIKSFDTFHLVHIQTQITLNQWIVHRRILFPRLTCSPLGNTCGQTTVYTRIKYACIVLLRLLIRKWNELCNIAFFLRCFIHHLWLWCFHALSAFHSLNLQVAWMEWARLVLYALHALVLARRRSYIDARNILEENRPSLFFILQNDVFGRWWFGLMLHIGTDWNMPLSSCMSKLPLAMWTLCEVPVIFDLIW